MLALAGYPLGMRFRFLDPSPDSPAGQLAECMTAPYTDAAALARFADGLDVVSFEFEQVPAETLRILAKSVAVHPSADILAVKQDRFTEKSYFRALGVATPDFATVDSIDDLRAGLKKIGLPAVLKTRRHGYDGKGQAIIRKDTEAEGALKSVGGKDLLLEQFIPFDRELSIIAVRGRDAATAFYPLSENVHRDGILRRSLAPTPAGQAMQAMAEDYAKRVFDQSKYVGVLAIEFFQQGGKLLVNEMAPRVHNSGHWTIEGAHTSQFENHLRAICGLPLGATAARGFPAMINLIGKCPDPAKVLAIPGANLHLYGKEPRAGRKIGHITVCSDSEQQRLSSVAQIERLVEDALKAESK
jgi:5-(carboxyamino)imidazole ribonucleotide synthase